MAEQQGGGTARSDRPRLMRGAAPRWRQARAVATVSPGLRVTSCRARPQFPPLLSVHVRGIPTHQKRNEHRLWHTRGGAQGMSLRAPQPTIDPELTSKYKGVFQLPDMAGTAPPVVYGKLSDSEFSLVATPAVEAGIPVSWKLQERKEAGHISLSIWKRDSKLNETILYGNGLPPLRR